MRDNGVQCLRWFRAINLRAGSAISASCMRSQVARKARKNLLYDATSVPHSTVVLYFLPSPRGSTRNGPTQAALQTGFRYGTFQTARRLILTSVSAQCARVSFSTPVTRLWRYRRASSYQRRLQSPLHNADDPVITAAEYLCRSSCLRMFLILFLRFPVRLALRITPKDVLV